MRSTPHPAAGLVTLAHVWLYRQCDLRRIPPTLKQCDLRRNPQVVKPNLKPQKYCLYPGACLRGEGQACLRRCATGGRPDLNPRRESTQRRGRSPREAAQPRGLSKRRTAKPWPRTPTTWPAMVDKRMLVRRGEVLGASTLLTPKARRYPRTRHRFHAAVT